MVDSIENVVIIKCDDATRLICNNALIVHDLSKQYDDNCLIKSVSTPGSHKFPFPQTVPSKDFYQNMLSKDFKYYKPIKMPKNKDYLVGKYSYTYLVIKIMTF